MLVSFYLRSLQRFEVNFSPDESDETLWSSLMRPLSCVHVLGLKLSSAPVLPSRTDGISHASADARLPPWARALFSLKSLLVRILFAHVPPKLILPKVWESEQDCGLKTTCNYLQIFIGTDPPLQEVWARLLACRTSRNDFSVSHTVGIYSSL